MSTPSYFYRENPSCSTKFGKVNYSKDQGHQSSVALTPVYGDFLDDITPWDTPNETREKERLKAEKDAVYQAQLDSILSQDTTVQGPSAVTYVMLIGGLLGTIYLLRK